jgi:hypothetical protein
MIIIKIIIKRAIIINYIMTIKIVIREYKV